jgi:hypothetical protein
MAEASVSAAPVSDAFGRDASPAITAMSAGTGATISSKPHSIGCAFGEITRCKD